MRKMELYHCFWRDHDDFFHDMMSIVEIVIPIVFEYFPVEITQSNQWNDCGGKKSKPSAVVGNVVGGPAVLSKSRK